MRNIIKCPHCGEEYLIEEIFYPEDFDTNPGEIIKVNGVLNGDYSNSLSCSPVTEWFTCDKCDKTFIVKAIVSVETEKDDFEEEYTLNTNDNN